MTLHRRTLLLALVALAVLAPGAAAAVSRPAHRSETARVAKILHTMRSRARLGVSSHPSSLWFGAEATQSAQPNLGGLGDPFGFGSSLVGSAPVGQGPSLLAVDPATHTIYVANGYNDNGPDAGGDTVSVINTRHCKAQDLSRCAGPWPTITVGNLPSAVAVDESTDTVYVADVGDDTVSVFNGATCNAMNDSGCGQTPAEVPVGLEPIGLFADPVNRTVYVANFGAPALGGSPGDSTVVSMINSATCNATDLSSCPTTAVPTVNVGGTPGAVDVDQATHSVYVTTISTGALNGFSVFDANTCNAAVQSGCGTVGYLAGDPNGPNDAQVDPANDTLYTANYDNTISVFNLSDCNAGDLAGCASDSPGTVDYPLGSQGGGFDHDLYVAVDAPLHSVYVTYQLDDTVVVVDTRTCNGNDLSGCATLNPPTIHTGASPEQIVLDPSTQTLYTANEASNDISVIDPSRCNSQYTVGCRHQAPTVPLTSPEGVVTEDAVHTAYVATNTNAVLMIDTATCNAGHLSGCQSTPPQFTAGDLTFSLAVDRATHTLYVVNVGYGSTGTVTVINDRTCNAQTQTGCAGERTLQVPGGNPYKVAVNPVTDTVYVTTDSSTGPNLISVFNGATCNASDASGCNQVPATVSVGSPYAAGIDLAVDDATNTLYVTDNLFGDPAGNSVYMIDGASCDSLNTGGCGQVPATITVGEDPTGLTVDPSTDTIYVAILDEGDYLGQVAVINGATCNAATTAGCGQTPATAPAGFGPLAIAIDLWTQRVYVTNLSDTSVSVINGADCNAVNASGCSQTPAEDAVGDYPENIAVDPAVGTAYVSNTNSLSVVPLAH